MGFIMLGRRQRLTVALIGAGVIWLSFCAFFVVVIGQTLIR